jgi:mono/diheme cytochrome c family protein
MTDVPEHLLRRSRERREALGLASGGGEPAGGGGDEAPAAPASPAPAPSTEVATQPAAVPAARPAAAVAVAEEPVATEPAYIKLDAKRRSKNPIWVMPVLVGLPLWAYFYAYAFSPKSKAVVLTPQQLGSQIYHGKGGCSGCHGGNGEGVGQFPKLAGGDAATTFPQVADQIEWVKTGSQSKPIGTPYGDPAREGGQRKVKLGVMPAFAGTLTQSEIEAVVAYERSL